MATFEQPGVKLDIPTPNEGEVFLADGLLAINQGGKIQQLSGVYGYGGETSGVNNQQVLSQLGLDPNSVRSFNLGDLQLGGLSYSKLGTYFNQGIHAKDYASDAERQAQLQANIKMFTDLYGQYGTGFGTGSSTTTGVYDPAAAKAALDPNNAVNTAARDSFMAGQQTFQTAAGSQQWYDPATGQPTPVGVGVPKPTTATGTQILNEQDLQAKRDELAKAGVPQAEWSKYISSPDAQGRLFYTQPATLTNPNTGQKKVVATGSTEASQLLASGWTLGAGVKDSTVNAGLMTPTPNLNIANTQDPNTSGSAVVVGGASETAKTIDEQIKKNLDLLNSKPESDLDKQVAKLISGATTAADALTGRGALQAEEEKKRQIEEKTNALTAKNTQLKTKLAEINALDASYQAANAQEELRPQTLSRLRGTEAANYRNYIAQRNLLAADAGIIQAELLGMQGELQAAQEAANRAVDLMYQDREATYNSKIAQLNILIPQLNKEDERYAQAVQLTLNQQAQADADAKQNQKDVLSVMMNAINAGITDSGVLSQIKNSASYADALQIYGQNIPTKAISSTGGGGGNIITTPTSLKPISFEEFISNKENELFMSIANPEDYRDEYEKMVVEQAKSQGTDLIGAYAEMVSKGQANLSSIPNAVRNEVALRVSELGGANTALSESAIKEIAETQNAIDGLIDLRSKIQDNLQYIGPISGLQSLNPFSKARQVQADVDRIRQTVGKALEGGVLRKEDEEKYKKILATLTDTPETALYKIDQLIDDIQTNYNRFLEAQSGAGRYTGGFEESQTTNNDPLNIL